MIETIHKPLLLIPEKTPLKKPQKIAFATDFLYPEKDIESVYRLIPFAKIFNAEILITYVDDEKELSEDIQAKMEVMFTELSNKADFPNIYYRVIKNGRIEHGLDWLCEHGQVDILAMLHREHSFFERLVKGSHTKKMADHITIPLLVLNQLA